MQFEAIGGVRKQLKENSKLHICRHNWPPKDNFSPCQSPSKDFLLGHQKRWSMMYIMKSFPPKKCANCQNSPISQNKTHNQDSTQWVHGSLAKYISQRLTQKYLGSASLPRLVHPPLPPLQCLFPNSDSLRLSHEPELGDPPCLKLVNPVSRLSEPNPPFPLLVP